MTNDSVLQYARQLNQVGHLSVLKHGSAGVWPIALVLFSTDGLCAVVAALAAVQLRTMAGGVIALRTYDMLYPSVALLLLSFWIVGLYPGIALNPVWELKRIVKSTTVTFLLLLAAAFFERDFLSYSRAMILVAWALCIGFIIVGRMLARSVFSRYDWWGVRTLVVGTSQQSERIASTLETHRHYGLRVVASIAVPATRSIPTIDLDSGESIQDSITKSIADDDASFSSIRYAILHLACIPAAQSARILDNCSQRFKRTLLVVELPGLSSFGAKARDFGGTLGLELPHQLLSASAQSTKRICDILVAGILLILLVPLVAAISIAIKLTSKGPLYYTQTRVGYKGKLLRVRKFRTMTMDADAVLSEFLRNHPSLHAEWLRDQKLRFDPRVTIVGRLLRKSSLDELPQLWNILMGDMSLVGPRPITSNEIHRYGTQFELYTRVVPGLTGLWQVSGRNNTSYRERVAYDEYYVRNWSVWMDLHILILTVKTVLTADGAY